jgi:hypothetical protein
MTTPNFPPHDTAPITMPIDTAARIASYGNQGRGATSDAVPALEAKHV